MHTALTSGIVAHSQIQPIVSSSFQPHFDGATSVGHLSVPIHDQLGILQRLHTGISIFLWVECYTYVGFRKLMYSCQIYMFVQRTRAREFVQET